MAFSLEGLSSSPGSQQDSQIDITLINTLSLEVNLHHLIHLSEDNHVGRLNPISLTQLKFYPGHLPLILFSLYNA